MVTHNPLHRSGQAVFPHPALASGDDAKSPERVGMTDAGRGQPAVDKPPHPVPEDSAVLAAPRERAVPESAHLESEGDESRAVHGDAVVTDVPSHDGAQPLAHHRNRVVHAALEFGFHLAQLRLQPFANRLPQHREAPITPLPPTDVCEAEEVERLGLPLATLLPVFGRVWAEFQELRFLGMQLEAELPEPFGELRPESHSVRLVLKAKHNVIREPYDDDVAAGPLPAPRLDPEVECVVEVDVRQERRRAAPLWRAFVHSHPLPVLQHAGVQPFLDEPHHAPVRYPVLEELHQPFVVDGVEEATNVQVEHPVHLLRQQPRVERVQCVVLAAAWPKPVREAEKVGFVDGIQHLDRRALDQLVFQRRYSERPLPPVGFGDVHPTDRLRPVRPSFQPIGEVLKVRFQFLPVVPPRLAVYARSGFPLEAEVGRSERFEIVDVVEKRREPHLLIPSCCLTYPLQRTARAFPARCPGRVLLSQVPFGQTLSLHPLRGRAPHVAGRFRLSLGCGPGFPVRARLGFALAPTRIGSSFVRRLRRYGGPVRLPVSVHRRRASLDFPTRPAAPSATGEHRISRFPHMVFPYVLGVSDRAGSRRISRYRCAGWGLPLLPTASAPRRKFLSRLITRPARAPVNASTPPSRAAPHDSGSVWVANPSPYDSFIHSTMPV